MTSYDKLCTFMIIMMIYVHLYGKNLRYVLSCPCQQDKDYS